MIFWIFILFCNQQLQYNKQLPSKVNLKVQTKKTRWSVGRFQKQFHRHDGGPFRLHALVFAKSPALWRLPN
jgi:hypothetical protein